ncbi:hypothetical protein PCASD_00304 [Puccinia coronata f. sp. avenae]|uniref:Uncharacterized protein n=1 Tax=Puccinia coronata f. sp. avenae TaxID=200324 RepID=A0A2N5VN65_9BASI|nr:hypothetical protein PCASD_00304 [Puccinia coronata f. sp. avenae]
MGPSTPPGHSPGFQDSIYTSTTPHGSTRKTRSTRTPTCPSPPPPHLYQVASDDSLRRICRTQAVVYSSGLSGSGKSTSMQLITKQLIKLSQLNSLGPSSQTLKLADQIPPLPESLSNPSTTAPPCGHTHQPACLTSTPPRLLPLRPASIVLGCYRIPICPDVDQIGFDDLQAAFRSLGFKSEHIQNPNASPSTDLRSRERANTRSCLTCINCDQCLRPNSSAVCGGSAGQAGPGFWSAILAVIALKADHPHLSLTHLMFLASTKVSVSVQSSYLPHESTLIAVVECLCKNLCSASGIWPPVCTQALSKTRMLLIAG